MFTLHLRVSFDDDTRHDLASIAFSLREIVALLRSLVVQPIASGFKITQMGAPMGVINGIVVGGTGTFVETVLPAGATATAITWSADDPLVTLTPSADGTSVSAATQATDTAPSFNLTVSGTNSAGAAISTTVNVPLLAAPPPVATGFDVTQTS